MFNLGFWEMIVLGFIALVVVGPEKLPGLARNLGRFLNDLKRTTNTITSEISSTMNEQEFFRDQENTDSVLSDEHNHNEEHDAREDHHHEDHEYDHDHNHDEHDVENAGVDHSDKAVETNLGEKHD